MKSVGMSKTGKIITAIIFGVFFCLMYMQFRLVGVQYDDYGYFSLNYCSYIPHIGVKFTFSEMFTFLKVHYTGANGRLLCDGFMLTIFKFGGLELIKLCAALIVTAIWILLYKVALGGSDVSSRYSVIGAGLLCLCYGGMHYLIHQHGTYWYIAFYIYYTPIIFTLLLVILYDKWKEDIKWYRGLVLSLLCFVSAWSFENWSAAIVILTLALTVIYVYNNKRFCMAHLFMFLSAAAGLTILIQSPGIRARAGDRAWGIMGFSEYEKNIKWALYYFFSEMNTRYVFYILTAVFVLAVSLYIKRRHMIDMVCASIVALIEAVLLFDYYLIQKLLEGSRSTLWLTVIILFASILTPVCRYYHFEKDKKRVMVLFTAFMSVAALAAVPDIQLRVYIPFEICSFLLVYDAGKEMYEGLKKEGGFELKPLLRGAGIAFGVLYLAVMIVYSSHNYIATYRGYSKNAEIYRENEAAILEAKENCSGDAAPVITLKRNADDRYASIMLYHQEWFGIYVSRYYGLPDGTKYVFE